MELALQTATPWRRRLKARLETPLVQRSLIALILVNAVILGLETSPTAMAGWGQWLIAADKAILAVLEGWAMDIVRPVMAVFPLAWVFFLLFILASTFTLLKLFIAVIVNAIRQEHGGDAKPPTDRKIAQLRLDVAALRNDLQSVRALAPGARRMG